MKFCLDFDTVVLIDDENGSHELEYSTSVFIEAANKALAEAVAFREAFDKVSGYNALVVAWGDCLRRNIKSISITGLTEV